MNLKKKSKKKTAEFIRQHNTMLETDDRLQQYALDHSSPLPPLLARIERETHVQVHKRLSVGDIQRLTEKNRSTLKVKLRDLVKMKKIKTFGKGRGVVYEIF